MATRIRELKNNLSRYILRIEAGERISVTAHGRVVAEIVPPASVTSRSRSRWDELIAAGTLTPPAEAGDPFENWPVIRLRCGTAAAPIVAKRSRPGTTAR